MASVATPWGLQNVRDHVGYCCVNVQFLRFLQRLVFRFALRLYYRICPLDVYFLIPVDRIRSTRSESMSLDCTSYLTNS